MSTKLKIDFLSEEEVSLIYEKSLDILWKKGVKVDHLPVLGLIEKQGAEVDFERKIARFPKTLVEAALKKVPSNFVLAGAVERYDLAFPRSSSPFYVRTNTGARNYLCPENNVYRDVTLEDVKDWVRLANCLEEVDFCALPFPSDAPAATADIHALRLALENSFKHIWVQPYSSASIEYLVELAALKAGGSKALKKRPIVSLISCALTPFEIKFMDAEAILQACKFGIPVHACSLPSAGGTSPFTVAGTVLICSTEILALTVITQLLQPGTPVIAVPLIFTLDMLNGRALQSSLEAMLGAAASVQFIRDAYGLPTHSYGFGSDSLVPDHQSMIERSFLGMLVSMAGADVLGGAGQVETASTISPVQLIIDNDIVKMLNRVRAGVEVCDETIAWDDIFETSPGGHFLDREHTLRHCRDGVRLRSFARQTRDAWLASGCKDLFQRSHDLYREYKRTYEPPELQDDLVKELERIVRRADESLANLFGS